MMNKRKKDSRQRGSHTHGWGAKKKHRGAGSRGGRGNAGSGKRGDAKKPSFWNDPSYYKSKGFVSLKKSLKSINISQLNKFENTKLDLSKEGYNKLLGMGKSKTKYDIKVSYASESAIKKIREAGGTVTLLKAKKEKKPKAPQKTVKPLKEEVDDTEEEITEQTEAQAEKKEVAEPQEE
ncbi:MAG: uL15m family ribosomal protein [archaeon]